MYKLILIFSLLIIVFLSYFIYLGNEQKKNIPNTNTIQYVPIGDSYTIGHGLSEPERWPNILVEHLNKEGVDIEIVENPAVSGYTVKDAINYELSVIERVRPDFVTIFLGANDNFQEKSADEFQVDLVELLDKVQDVLKDKRNIVLITIPDYSKSPAGSTLYNPDKTSKSIAEYNDVIKQEAKKRKFQVVDLYTISQQMTDSSYYIDDGLHPSAEGYKKWEKVIYLVVYKLLNKSN